MNINNLDDIKSRWQAANAPLADMADDTLAVSRKALRQRGSAQDKLAAQYRRMVLLAVVGLALWVAAACMIDFVAWARPWIIAAAAVFFAVAGGMDGYLYRAVRRIDLVSWPVSAVALEGRRLLRLHKLFILLLFPMALGLVFFMVCSLDVPLHERQEFIWAAAVGGGIGLVIGVGILLRFLRLYRSLTDTLD